MKASWPAPFSSKAQTTSGPSSLLAVAHAVPSAMHVPSPWPVGERLLGKPAVLWPGAGRPSFVPPPVAETALGD